MAAAITLVKDETHGNEDWSSKIRQLTYLVSGDGLTATGPALAGVTGTILGMLVDPSASAKPDAAWDLTWKNTAGFDLLDGAGTDLPTDNLAAHKAYRNPVDATNKASIFLFNQTMALSVAGFKTTGSASATVEIYLQLP